MNNIVERHGGDRATPFKWVSIVYLQETYWRKRQGFTSYYKQLLSRSWMAGKIILPGALATQHATNLWPGFLIKNWKKSFRNKYGRHMHAYCPSNSIISRNPKCCIFQPAFGCCALQTMVKIVTFSLFCAKNLKKARNLQQISAKKSFFLHLHQNTGRLF